MGCDVSPGQACRVWRLGRRWSDGYRGEMASGSVTKGRGGAAGRSGSAKSGGSGKGAKSGSTRARSGSGAGGAKRASSSRTRAASSSRTPPRKSTGSAQSARRGGKGSGAAGSAVRGGWNLAAKGVGGLARAVGRTRDLEPEHRRDGLALGLIALALITAVGVLREGAGPVGDVVTIGMRSVLRAGSVAVPLVLLVVAVALMRSEANPDTRPRRVIGTMLMSLSVLGLLHLLNARPQAHEGQMYAGGWLGWFSGDLLARGVTVWVATP